MSPIVNSIHHRIGFFAAMTFLVVAPATAQDSVPETQPVLLQMIRDDAVHQELTLRSDQKQRILEQLQAVDGTWFRVRIRPADERAQVIEELTATLRQSLQSILDPQQSERLDQLINQALGTRMITRDQTARALSMTAADREKLYEVFVKTDQATSKLQSQLKSGELDAAAANRQLADIKGDEKQAFISALTNEQKRQLSGLTGETFDFGQIKRMYPLAPELTDDGATWLQGGDLKLDDLRGKVVAIHFYAFQCINCQRNLPHYNGWHQDYSDDGLVVIGIQTPETSAERSAERVAAAITSDQIEYPVLMDAQSANWRNWSNTMWPTVYLVDKKGFLRRWWQGEMNWKGIEGEKQMRTTIEQLLAESE